MSIFSSQREKHLWTWAAVVLTAIYSTLGLARTFAGALRDEGILSDAMWLALFLIALAIIVQALKKKRSGAEIGVILGVIGVYIITLSRMAIPEERSHIIEYSILALCIFEALKERVENGRRVPVPGLVAFGATVLFGFIDEGIQLVMPSRTFDWFDILFDAIAAFMAISGSLMITGVSRWVRRKRER